MRESGSGRALLRAVVGFAFVLVWPAAGFGQIVINEIMQNPRAVPDTDRGEWFELYNAGSRSVDMAGWKIKDDEHDSHVIDSANGTTTIAAGSYLVLCANPDMKANGGVRCDYDYDYNSFKLSNSSDEVVLIDANDVERARVVYYDSDTFPLESGVSMAFISPDLDNNEGANWCRSAAVVYGDGDHGTPGAANACTDNTAAPAEIFEIQGKAETSPHDGAMVKTANNVVTAVAANGFFIQTPSHRSDEDADTSDGIFVNTVSSPTVAAGDVVNVTGQVVESDGFTTIAADSSVSGAEVSVVGVGEIPAPVAFDAARPSPDPDAPSCAIEFECYEGMLIRIDAGTISSPNQRFKSDPVAEMYITATTSRAFREPGLPHPGIPIKPDIPVFDGNPELFELDADRLGLDNVVLPPGSTIRATGVLGFEHGGYEMWPFELTVLSEAAVPRPVRARTADEVTIGSLNLHRLSSSAEDYAIRLNKLSLYIREVLLSPDILGVQEVQGIAELSALADLIRTDDPRVDYRAHIETSSGDIEVGFLVRSRVQVVEMKQYGADEMFVDPTDLSVDRLHDRPPLLLQALIEKLPLSVLVIHNRSLLKTDTSARVRRKRLEQAQSVARLVQSLQGSKLIVVGDFNGFQFSDGYVDVVGQIAGTANPLHSLECEADMVDPNLYNAIARLPAAERYSYVFAGSAQALDHALVNQALRGSLVEMQYGRGNADASRKREDDATVALRSSDHDGLVVFLRTQTETAQAPLAAASR